MLSAGTSIAIESKKYRDKSHKTTNSGEQINIELAYCECQHSHQHLAMQ
jgi:hypothetical protein